MMGWTAGFRAAVIDPEEQIQFTEPRGFHDHTVRQVLHMAGGGDQLRIRLTNLFGRVPLSVGAAVASTDHGRAALTFDAAPTLSIPPGGEAVSDPVELRVDAGASLTLSLYLPEETGLATHSPKPMETARVVPGNHVSGLDTGAAEVVEGRFFVSGVDVLAPDDTRVAVAFGDSWFEGVGSTISANRRSVDVLNRRLSRGWVVNLGSAGNRLLADIVGPSGLTRFDRDVASIPSATHVLVHFGINDFGLPGMLGQPPASATAMIEGFRLLADRAHAADLKIVVATIGPFAGAVYPGVSTPEGLAARREVNDWIRTGGVFDGVVDVANAVADPDAPDFIHPQLDSGDGMHLNDQGALAMADAVDLVTLVR